MNARFIRRDAPRNVPRTVATLYRDGEPLAPVADVFDADAAALLTAAPLMASALRQCLAVLRDPGADLDDAHRAEAAALAALRQAGEIVT